MVCKDGSGLGENYCSEWCGNSGKWGKCGINMDDWYKCDCKHCGSCWGNNKNCVFF